MCYAMVHIALEALHCIAASTNLLMVMVGDAHASKAFVAELDKLKAIDVCSKGSLSWQEVSVTMAVWLLSFIFIPRSASYFVLWES